MFLDLLVVLGSLNSPVLTDHAGSVRHALAMLADYQESTGTQMVGKLAKAKMALEQAGLRTGAEDRAGMVKVIKGDLLAMDRLRALRGV